MKLTKRNYNPYVRRRSNNRKILEEFNAMTIDKECESVEVTNYSHKNANGCATALNASAKRYHILNVRAVVNDGRVYLIKL